MQFKRTDTLMYLLAAPHALIAKFTSPLKLVKDRMAFTLQTATLFPLDQKRPYGGQNGKQASCLYKNGRQSCKSDKKSFFRFLIIHPSILKGKANHGQD